KLVVVLVSFGPCERAREYERLTASERLAGFRFEGGLKPNDWFAVTVIHAPSVVREFPLLKIVHIKRFALLLRGGNDSLQKNVIEACINNDFVFPSVIGEERHRIVLLQPVVERP